MSLSRIVRWAIILIVGFYVLKFMGMTPADLWNKIMGRVQNFKEDTQQLTSGKAVQQISENTRAEMKKAQESTPVVADPEMNRELQAERARVMEAKLDALHKAKIVPVEQGKLNEQVIKNAQAAGGGQ